MTIGIKSRFKSFAEMTRLQRSIFELMIFTNSNTQDTQRITVLAYTAQIYTEINEE